MRRPDASHAGHACSSPSASSGRSLPIRAICSCCCSSLGVIGCSGSAAAPGALPRRAGDAGVCSAIAVLPLGSWAIVPLEERFPQPALPRADRRHHPARRRGRSRRSRAAHGEVALNEFRRAHHRDAGAGAALSRGARADLRRRSRGLIAGGVDRGAGDAQAARSPTGSTTSRLLLEERSRNTYRERGLFQGAGQPQPGQVWLLVTSAFHMPRAVGCFRAVGWDVLPYPGRLPDRRAPQLVVLVCHRGLHLLVDIALHEWVGLVAYRAARPHRLALSRPAPISASSAR